MKCTFVGGLGLALGLVVAAAAADEIQWRPAPPSVTSNSLPAVSLGAPVADATPLQQTGFNGNTSANTNNGARVTVAQSPQPMPAGPYMPVGPSVPVGPTLQIGPPFQPEKGPKPSPVFISQPIPGDGGVVFKSNSGPVGPPGFVSVGPPGLVGPCPVDPCNPCGDRIVGCDDCGGTSGWWARHRDPSKDCCDPCFNACCEPRSCFWLSAEYLLWTIKGEPLPPLVTSNSFGGPPVLGVPGTSLAFGGGREDFDLRSGGRVTVGFGIPGTCNNLGLEASYFMLLERTNSYTFSSNGVPSLGRPFTNVGPAPSGFPGNQDAELVALPGVVAGSVSISTRNELWGAEANLRMPIACGCCWKADFLAGFRYLELNEDLIIVENLNVQQPTTRGVGNIVVIDRFSTRNQFYGGQIGVDAECRWNRWFVGGTGKVALGNMHQQVTIDGATIFRDGPNPGTERGGLLALPGTNIGQYNRDTFCVIPEVGVRVGYYFTEHLRGFVGYNFLYVSNVVRPGDQVDLNVNPTFLPRNGPPVGQASPAFQFRNTDFWAQGFTFGLELRY